MLGMGNETPLSRCVSLVFPHNVPTWCAHNIAMGKKNKGKVIGLPFMVLPL